jgi:hypothetical protein
MRINEGLSKSALELPEGAIPSVFNMGETTVQAAYTYRIPGQAIELNATDFESSSEREILFNDRYFLKGDSLYDLKASKDTNTLVAWDLDSEIDETFPTFKVGEAIAISESEHSDLIDRVIVKTTEVPSITYGFAFKHEINSTAYAGDIFAEANDLIQSMTPNNEATIEPAAQPTQSEAPATDPEAVEVDEHKSVVLIDLPSTDKKIIKPTETYDTLDKPDTDKHHDDDKEPTLDESLEPKKGFIKRTYNKLSHGINTFGLTLWTKTETKLFVMSEKRNDNSENSKRNKRVAALGALTVASALVAGAIIDAKFNGSGVSHTISAHTPTKHKLPSKPTLSNLEDFLPKPNKAAENIHNAVIINPAKAVHKAAKTHDKVRHITASSHSHHKAAAHKAEHTGAKHKNESTKPNGVFKSQPMKTKFAALAKSSHSVAPMKLNSGQSIYEDTQKLVKIFNPEASSSHLSSETSNYVDQILRFNHIPANEARDLPVNYSWKIPHHILEMLMQQTNETTNSLKA